MMLRLQNIFQRNLVAKIIALLAAVILWSYVMNDQNPATDSTFTVQLTALNAPDGYKISYDNEKIKLKVKAPRSLFINLNEKDFKAYVDLKGLDAGTHQVDVKTSLPQGMELVEADPEQVMVTLDRIVSRKIKTEFIVSGAAGPDATVAHVKPDVEYVTIEGPESAVQTVSRVIGYVGLSGNTNDFQLQVPLTAINSDGREVSGVTVTPGNASVTVQMARGLNKKIVLIQPQVKQDLGEDYELVKVSTDPAKIEIAGDAKALAAMNSVSTEEISLADVKKTTDKAVRLTLPEGVTVTNQTVNVHIEVRAKPNSGKKKQ
jgi:YbbR domain-containing protein